MGWSAAHLSPLTVSQLLAAVSLSGELVPELLELCLLDDKLLWLFLQEIMLRLYGRRRVQVLNIYRFLKRFTHIITHITHIYGQQHSRPALEAELSFTTFETAKASHGSWRAQHNRADYIQSYVCSVRNL